MSVGGICNFLLIDRIWQRWWEPSCCYLTSYQPPSCQQNHLRVLLFLLTLKKHELYNQKEVNPANNLGEFGSRSFPSRATRWELSPWLNLDIASQSTQLHWAQSPDPQKLWDNKCVLFCFVFINLFIYFSLHWIFIVVHGHSLVAASRSYSSLPCTGFSLQWLLLLQSMDSRCTGFSSCGTWAQ